MKNKKQNPKCPKCGSTNYQVEKRPNSDAVCLKYDCEYVGKFSEWFEDDSSLYIKDDYDDKKFIDARGDIILAKGGDGTLLRAINKFRHLNKPFYGIGAGTENFLMNATTEACRISDNAKYKKFNLIKVSVTYKKNYTPDCNDFMDGKDDFRTDIVTEDFQAFNDVMIGGSMNDWIAFDVHDPEKIIGKFKGGGVIVCTAQGSTGINKNNGGSVLPLNAKQWFITGDKTNRKISVPINPKRTTITAESRHSVTVWVDGQNHIIKNVQKIELSKGDSVTVIFNDYEAFKRKRRV